MLKIIPLFMALFVFFPYQTAYSVITPDRVYDPMLNSSVTPDGTVYDRLTGKILKNSEHPLPNYGIPVKPSSEICDTTYVKARTEDGMFLVTSDGITLHISDNPADVTHWQPNDELRICGDRAINIDDNTSTSFTYN